MTACCLLTSLNTRNIQSNFGENFGRTAREPRPPRLEGGGGQGGGRGGSSVPPGGSEQRDTRPLLAPSAAAPADSFNHTRQSLVSLRHFPTKLGRRPEHDRSSAAARRQNAYKESGQQRHGG